jgi:hypothetical protein
MIQIEGAPIEGEELFVEKEYWGGEEGESRLQWYLVSPLTAKVILSNAAV